jgi:hypothetical protein
MSTADAGGEAQGFESNCRWIEVAGTRIGKRETGNGKPAEREKDLWKTLEK